MEAQDKLFSEEQLDDGPGPEARPDAQAGQDEEAAQPVEAAQDDAEHTEEEAPQAEQNRVVGAPQNPQKRCPTPT